MAPTHDGAAKRQPIVQLIREAAEPITDVENASFDGLLERIGDARVVLLGEATHGTHEFYRARARITKALIEQKGFGAVCIEGDWPDAAQVDAFVRRGERGGIRIERVSGGHGGALPGDGSVKPRNEVGAVARRRLGEGADAPKRYEEELPFTRFPRWMWRNTEVKALVEWLREHNQHVPGPERVGFFGLDLYSLYESIEQVLVYLDEKDPEAAARARGRYGCLLPWEAEAQGYGYAVATGSTDPCEAEVIAMLQDLLAKRLEYLDEDGHGFVNAVMNARLVANAEAYYRTMYMGSVASWNLRDTHMTDTLEQVLAFLGPSSKAVVWAHNSHLGDARATQMGEAGEVNIGQLCRERFGEKCFSLGFGTDHGTVRAADDWGLQGREMNVMPSREDSFERLCHETEIPAFLLHLREPDRDEVREALAEERLERAIGVVYRPEMERLSHYFRARLAEQFDAYLWVDETRALVPRGWPEELLGAKGRPEAGPPETYPSGL